MLKVEDVHALIGQLVLDSYMERKTAIEMLKAKDEEIKQLKADTAAAEEAKKKAK